MSSTTDDLSAAPVHHRLQRTHTRQLLANGLLLALWSWLYWPLAAYLRLIFTREDFRTNQVLLAAVLGLIVLQVRRRRGTLRIDAPPRLRRLPLALALGSSLAYLAVERFFDVNTVAASLFGLATYGLMGLWLAPARWRHGLPAALLLIGTLPFGEHMQTFIGYPMRIATAALVQDGLAAAGVATVGVDTILVFENGVSQVDVPCSGVKSLWTGAMFLVAATWIEGRRLRWRWLGTAVLFAVTLFLVNLARVAILVTVGEVLGLALLAEMMHVPLGVLGFIAACAVAVTLLRRIPRLHREDGAAVAISPSRQAPRWLTPALLVAVLAMALLYAERPQTGLQQPAPDWAFPPELVTEPLPFQPDEYEWLTRDGADSASRYRFRWGDLSGSMILITSRTWRAHHRPERCFEVYGLSLEETRTRLVTPALPVRSVSLGDGDRQALYAATYWFQSATRTTDDYGTRIWADLPPDRERWVLVSILFDDASGLDDAALAPFYLATHEAVAAVLSGKP